jgi:hypothetical protein
VAHFGHTLEYFSFKFVLFIRIATVLKGSHSNSTVSQTQELEHEVKSHLKDVFAEKENSYYFHKRDPADHGITTVVICCYYIKALQNFGV